MKRLTKRISAMCAAVMMLLTLPTIGAGASTIPSSRNWSVTNVNGHVFYRNTIRANGYRMYSLTCTKFTGQASDTYVQHYPYYMSKNNGYDSPHVCAPIRKITKTIYLADYNYSSDSIPVYDTTVYETFRLYQPTSSTVEKAASGVVKTKAAN